jgi:GT2 family glycosyltransferase
MSLFQNTSLHPIPIMLNGIRKTIKPGEQFHGPDNLSAIPGISLVNPTTRTVINRVPTQVNNITPSPQMFTPQTAVKTDFSKDAAEELNHLKYLKSLNDNPSVTIAVLTKNRFELIRDCCESLFEKVNYKNLTLMIIDTGTNEKQVRDYYETLETKCKNKNWKYKFVQLTEFHYSKNYNTAIFNHVDTEYVLIQNNDTVALNDYITEMMYTAVIRKVGSVGCRMFYPDKVSIQHDGQTIFNAPNEQFGSASHVNLRQNKSNIPQSEGYTHFVDGNTAAGVLMKTSDYKKIEGFDENFGDIFQDVHLMIKIPNMLNKFNYCNRMANIIHIDNASRLHGGVDQKKHVQMWEDTHYLRKSLVENRWGKLKKPKSCDFSIITPVYDLDSYEHFLNSIKNQIGSHTIELIPVPNFYNMFNSAYKALNTGGDVASGKIIIYCHDDIVVTPNWLNKIKEHLSYFETQRLPVGVLGPAGISLKEESSFFLLDEAGVEMYKTNDKISAYQPRYQVQTLDEMCLITLKTNNLRFDDNQLTGWHFYGANLCIKALAKGLNNFAIDAYLHHKSDGSKNLNTVEKFNKYEECARRFDTWAKQIGVQNWRTTTAKFVNNTIYLFPPKPKSS